MKLTFMKISYLVSYLNVKMFDYDAVKIKSSGCESATQTESWSKMSVPVLIIALGTVL